MKCPKGKLTIKVVDKYPDGRVETKVEYLPKPGNARSDALGGIRGGGRGALPRHHVKLTSSIGPG